MKNYLRFTFIIIIGILFISGIIYAEEAKKEAKTFNLILNTWGGWSGIIAANNGFTPTENCIIYKNCNLKLKISVVENFSDSWSALNGGKTEMMGLTLDMLALNSEGIKDKMAPPKAFVQIDWSNGGDGIIVRGIKSIADFKDKKGIMALNSPSQYFILDVLLKGGVDPKTVQFIEADDAFLAASTFASNKDLSFAVAWAPAIYEIPEKNPDVKLFTSTATANRVIADVLIARPEFIKNNIGDLTCFVKALFEGFKRVETETDKVAELLSKGFNVKVDEAKSMMKDAELTGLEANKKFFTDINNPASVKGIFESAQNAYKSIGSVKGTVSYNEIYDDSVIKLVSH